MLRALEPGDAVPPSAYPVPWRVDRSVAAHPVVVNASRDPLDFVRAFIDHPRVCETELWGRMLPGEGAQLCLCDIEVADAVLTIAWFRPETGDEYVWRFTV